MGVPAIQLTDWPWAFVFSGLGERQDVSPPVGLAYPSAGERRLPTGRLLPTQRPWHQRRDGGLQRRRTSGRRGYGVILECLFFRHLVEKLVNPLEHKVSIKRIFSLLVDMRHSRRSVQVGVLFGLHGR